MRLSSVQSLKEELSSEQALPTTFVRSVGMRRSSTAFSARAHRAHVREPKSTEVALGVCKGKRKGDYRLSARIQITRGARKLAEQIKNRARGECDTDRGFGVLEISII